MSRAIKDLPSDSALRRFLKAHEAEVKEMCLTEYNEKEERELLRQEAFDIGKAEGKIEGLNSYDKLLRELIVVYAYFLVFVHKTLLTNVLWWIKNYSYLGKKCI